MHKLPRQLGAVELSFDVDTLPECLRELCGVRRPESLSRRFGRRPARRPSEGARAKKVDINTFATVAVLVSAVVTLAGAMGFIHAASDLPDTNVDDDIASLFSLGGS